MYIWLDIDSKNPFNFVRESVKIGIGSPIILQLQMRAVRYLAAEVYQKANAIARSL